MDRVRGRRLQEIRRRHFMAQPLCVMCEQAGRVRLATQLDHIVALANNGEDIESNRQALCDECHRMKTASDLGIRYRPSVGKDGWPVTR